MSLRAERAAVPNSFRTLLDNLMTGRIRMNDAAELQASEGGSPDSLLGGRLLHLLVQLQ